jgi:subtilase family serine protease
MPSETNLNLAIGLPLRNREALTNLLEDLYNPASPNYRHYLTPEQFTERFGPTPEQYQAVIAFARTNGLTVTGKHPNRLLLDVRGKVSDIQNAFHTTLRLYSHPTEARAFYAPDTEPSVERALPVLDVSGLNNLTRPHPKSLRVMPDNQGSTPTSKGGSGPSGTYIGQDFRGAYARGTTLTGAGQVLGLLEFDGYYPSDITSYETLASLPNVPIQTVLIDGFNGIPITGPNAANNEVALDIEVAISMAPGLSKVLVYESDPIYALPNDIISRMATDNLAAQISCSWNFGTGPSDTTEQIFQQFAAQGQSFFNASGDNGAYSNSVAIPVPDADPFITIVGGTVLTTTGPGGSWVSETTWNAGGGLSSGGGFDPTVPIPSWQQGISMAANHGSTSARNIPDVSMVAQDITVIADNGQTEMLQGTSIAAPLWAGLTALINQQAAAKGHSSVGFINPAVYALGKGPNYTSYFHDITTGNNISGASGNNFVAAPGFDLCTGWGTPSGPNLINALAIPDSMGVLPANGFSANGPAGGPFNTSSQTFTLTNSGSASFDWNVGGGAPWLNISPNAGTLAPGTGTSGTVTLTPAATGLAAGTYSANLGFTNLTSNFVQTREINLSVGSSIVLNGGFESGDLAYWTLNGSDADNFVDDGTTTSVTPRSGNFVAVLGQVGSLGTLKQTLPTQTGQGYLLSMWLIATSDTSGQAFPNVFRVVWNGKTLFGIVNFPDSGWTNLEFIVTAPGPNTVLSFLFEDDNAYLGLDDVSVIPIPPPRFQPVTLSNGSIQLTWNSMAGLSYQVQYKTDLNQSSWTNLGSSVPSAGTTTSTTAALPASSAFYRLLVQLPN